MRVLIAGGGFAALEAALALRALAQDRISLSFVAPGPLLRYRPAATVEAFGPQPVLAYSWTEIADDLHARHQLGRVEAVVPEEKFVRLASGLRLDYDVLILCIGARALAGVAGARTFRDQRDLAAFEALLADLADGQLTRLVFAVPPGISWPLPLYELALSSAAHAQRAGGRPRSRSSPRRPSRWPCSVPRCPRGLRDVLDGHEVRFLPGRTPVAVRRDGALELQADGSVPADAVVTVPQLCAHRHQRRAGELVGICAHRRARARRGPARRLRGRRHVRVSSQTGRAGHPAG